MEVTYGKLMAFGDIPRGTVFRSCAEGDGFEKIFVKLWHDDYDAVAVTGPDSGWKYNFDKEDVVLPLPETTIG